MFRVLENLTFGRKCVLNKNLNFSQIEDIITSTKGNRIRVFSRPNNGKYDYFVSSSEALRLLSDYTSIENKEYIEKYIETNFQVFKGKNIKKYYIDIFRGKRILVDNGNSSKIRIYERMTFCWKEDV